MSEMIARGATAVLAKVPLGYGMTRLEALEYSRAVIEAIREPTEDMLDAACLAEYNSVPSYKTIWQAMIDTAAPTQVGAA